MMRRYGNLGVGSVFLFFSTQNRGFGFQNKNNNNNFFDKKKRKAILKDPFFLLTNKIPYYK